MDAEGNRPAELDEDGIPVGGEETYENAVEVPWSDVGFKVIDELTFELTLRTKKSQWQVMTQLSSAITSVVHPANFEAGKIEGGERTNYGTIDNPLVSFGVYELTEWVPGAFYIFTRNDNHYGAADYDIRYLRYDVISDQSVAVAEFIKGNLDVAAVSGEYFPVYENSEYLKLTPVTTFFRFAFSLDRGRDGSAENDTPIMQDKDFRLALYYATDRETFVTDVRSPGYPTQSILGPLYYSSEQNPFSYRGSAQGQAVMDDYSPETFGYDPVQAKALFDQAYANAVADGLYADGEVVEIEFVFFDAETNHTMANWLESTWENIFGDNFDLVKTPVDGDTLDAAWDNGNFDLTFGGWQGLQFWAPQMLQVYSDVKGAAYILEVGFETGNAELEVDLGNGKVAVTQWLADLNAKTEKTETDEKYIGYFEDFLDGFTGDIYTGTYDNLWSEVYSVILDYDLYDGRDVDFDNITAAMESELLEQMINIPLFTVVGASIYSSRVVFDAEEYHARMGWGGYKYMSLEQE
jgi:oligopeptide transport system substrate-binding protein